MIDFRAILLKHEEVNDLYIMMQEWKDIATDTANHISGLPSGGGDGKRLENDVGNIVDIEREWIRANTELKAMKKELNNYLPCLTKKQHKDAIEKRYIDGKRIKDIMKVMGYGRAQVNRYLAEGREIILAAEHAQK